ncbi:MAG: glycosyltransferase family 39 protein [Calditrichaeota bacterium]|nr:glycosyltransferase family 39 protein [Calditrichota bacterium]MCB9369242.1 glycosyltransferase family 39 protein [Calditrichota bacterium]
MKRLSILISLLVIGAGFRLFVIELRPAGAMLLAPDEPEYLETAQNIWLGNGFSFHGEPTGYRDMLMPYVAAGVMNIFGDFKPMFYLQLILSLLTGLFLYFVAAKRFTEGIAYGVLAVWMLYPAAAIFCSLFLTETMFLFFWVLAIWLHDRLEEHGYTIRDSLLLGIVLGLLCLTRATGTILIATVFIYVFLIRYETPLVDRARAVSFVLIGALVIMLPWMIRNQVTMDRFWLNTNGGINVLIGNNPYANGGYLFDERVEQMIPAEAHTEAARDIAASQAGKEYAQGHLRKTFAMWPTKFAYLWSTDMAMLAHFAPVRGSESLATTLHMQPLGALVLTAIPFAVLVILGLCGFYLVRKFPARGFFILQLALGAAAAFVTYGLPRYHYPLMPAVIIGAAAYVENQPWDGAPQWRRLLLLLAIGMFMGVWTFETVKIIGWM